MADLKCPNCGAVCVAGSDGKSVCGACGGSFAFVAGEAKLKDVSEFDKLRADVDELKQRLPASTPAEPAEHRIAETLDGQQPDEEDEGDDDEEDL